MYTNLRSSYIDALDSGVLSSSWLDLFGSTTTFFSNLKSYEGKISIDYESSKTKYIKSLKRAYEEGKLVLVLGSGISTECGLPDWDILLQKLLLKLEFSDNDSEDQSLIIAKIYSELFNPSQLIAARYIRNNYDDYRSNNKRISFEKFVRNSLYEGKINNEPLIFKDIYQFCLGGHGGPIIDSIITYNFDDLLESYLEKMRVPCKAIYSEGMSYNRRQTPIYHVHGFLPRGGLNRDHKIILSEDMYHRQYSETHMSTLLMQEG